MGNTGTSAGVEGMKLLVVVSVGGLVLVLVGGALGATDVTEGNTDDVPDVAVAAGTTGMAEGVIVVCGNT